MLCSAPKLKPNFGRSLHKIRLHLPHHLYFVSALPSKTLRYMLDLLMLVDHKQSYVTVLLNKAVIIARLLC